MTGARHRLIWALTFPLLAGWAVPSVTAVEHQEGLTGLEGIIANDRGEPLVGAIVSVFGAPLARGGLIAVSDENGHFRVSDLPPGLYTLRAYLSGFLPSRFSRVEVAPGRKGAVPLLMRLARLEQPEPGRSVSPLAEDPVDEDEGSGRTRELKWLLRHAKRNVLHRTEEALPAQVARVERQADAQSAGGAPDIDVEGEVGLLASASDMGLSHFFPGSGAGLDARLAYARVNIPVGSQQRWEVNAQLMESVLSSWAGSAQFISEREGRSTTAGVSYGNHLYGDLDAFRPPEAGLGRRSDEVDSTEWFGSVFGARRFKLGAAEVDAGLAYHYYSYLGEPGYAAPHLEVSWSPGSTGRTVVKGVVDYKVLAPGSEDLDLLARLASADFIGTPEPGLQGLRAEKTLRSQVSLQRRLGDDSLVVEVRLFQEDAVAQLVKAYRKDEPDVPLGPGRYFVWNQGDYRTRGVGLAVSRRFGFVASSVGYRFGLARGVGGETARVAAGDEEIHDLTTSVETEIDRTRTRLLATVRVIRHPALFRASASSAPGRNNLDSRFNFQVHQVLPFLGWESTEWELMLAVRNLFYQDIDHAAFLDELAVLDSPRRLLGGVSVRF